MYSDKFLQLQDRPDAPLYKFFEKVSEKIDSEIKNGGNVLVHCVMGVSRKIFQGFFIKEKSGQQKVI